MALVTRICTFSVILALAAGCSSAPHKKPLSDDDHAHLLLGVANGALIEGDPTGALQTLLQAEELAPKMPEVHHSKALAFYAKNDFTAALKEAKLAVELAPEYADANNTLGKILVDQGRFSEAVSPLLKAAKNNLYREAYKSWTNLGILYYRKGDLAKAEENFQRAIQTSREEACIAFYYEGHLKLRGGNYADAIRDYKKATERTCAGFADAHLAIAITYERTKQYQEARKSFLAVQTHFPNTKAADAAVDHLRNLP